MACDFCKAKIPTLIVGKHTRYRLCEPCFDEHYAASFRSRDMRQKGARYGEAK
jgi:hypothetical protein